MAASVGKQLAIVAFEGTMHCRRHPLCSPLLVDGLEEVPAIGVLLDDVQVPVHDAHHAGLQVPQAHKDIIASVIDPTPT